MATVKLLKEELEKTQTNKGRALDAGCGDGRLVKHIFALMFTQVDMFDPSEEGLAICQEMKRWNPVLDRVEKKTFKTWKWKDDYDAIFMTQSAGYIEDYQLVKWLKEAKKHLNNRENQTQNPGCFIWLFDNIAAEGVSEKVDMQWHRPIHTFEEIFDKAGVTIYIQVGPKKIHKEYGQQVLFALY